MSSNTSAPEPIAHLAQTSFHLLRSDAPTAFARLVDQMAGQDLLVDLGDEVMRIRFDEHGPRLHDPAGPDEPTVRLTTDRATIGALLDGRLGLADAVDTDQVAVLGDLDDLLRAHDGLTTYIHAAVRTRSVPDLVGRVG